MRPIHAGLCLIALSFSASAIDLSAEWRLDEEATLAHIRGQHEYDAAVESALPEFLVRARQSSYQFEGSTLLAHHGATSERIPIRWIERRDDHALLRGRTRGQNFEIYLEYLDSGNLRMHSTLDDEMSVLIWQPGRTGEHAEILTQATMGGELVTDVISNPDQ